MFEFEFKIYFLEVPLLVKFGLNKNNFVIMSLSLSWTCYRDKVSLFVNFEPKKIKMMSLCLS